METDIGSSVILSCDVDGQPQPEIRWLFHEPGRIGVSEYHDEGLMVDLDSSLSSCIRIGLMCGLEKYLIKIFRYLVSTQVKITEIRKFLFLTTCLD